jgi:cell division protein ZapA
MKGINVEIMGQSLLVAGEADEQWIKAVAETVDEKIRSISAATSTANSVNLAILAALNFADELERLRKQHKELIDQIRAMTRRLGDSMTGSGPN